MLINHAQSQMDWQPRRIHMTLLVVEVLKRIIHKWDPAVTGNNATQTHADAHCSVHAMDSDAIHSQLMTSHEFLTRLLKVYFSSTTDHQAYASVNNYLQINTIKPLEPHTILSGPLFPQLPAFDNLPIFQLLIVFNRKRAEYCFTRW